jgi:hypothetical protein
MVMDLLYPVPDLFPGCPVVQLVVMNFGYLQQFFDLFIVASVSHCCPCCDHCCCSVALIKLPLVVALFVAAPLLPFLLLPFVVLFCPVAFECREPPILYFFFIYCLLF